MPANDGSGRNQNERSPPSGPESLQDNPEQLVQDGQSPARTVSVQRKKLLTQSEIFENEIPSGTECNDKPSQEMPERHDYAEIMARILSEDPASSSFQAVHSASTRSFDEGQDYHTAIKIRVIG